MLRCDGGPSVKRRISEDFAGTQRFEILRCLGAGGMGTVYEAFDRERKERVALKTLRAMNAESLLRFKHEFREFQDLSHPNLVSVGELFSDEGDWFFTMELLDGVDFLDYVRPGLARASNDTADTIVTLPQVMEKGARIMRVSTGTLLNEARLRTALRQLAFGLHALHEANKVHRDIKPSNILVTERGRVVLLDFGLATELEGREHKSEVDIVGTVEYMAPEQAAARQVGPPADWYSIGVVLFEALTGQLPLVGPAIEVLMNKQRLEAPSPRALNPNAPADLTQLCMDLMRFNPAERPTGRQVLDRLGAAAQSQSPSASLSSFSTSSSFVGRERELEELRHRFERSRHEAQTVLVHGESGVGKSALVRRFVELLKERDGGVVTLAGTCYERESVPFKAVDGLVDALSQYMRRLPKAEAAALLPRRAGLLAQVFPVLQRVEAVAEAPRAAEDVLDPQELRSRLFGALRELLSRLTDRHPLVLVIDDLQWADADSLALLGELVRPPESPLMLLVATVRTAEESSGPSRREALAEHLRGEVRHLPLGRMSDLEALQLTETLVRRAPGPIGLNAAAIAQEAGGHPLFIDELIRHAVAVGGPARTALQLEDALWARISQLEGNARRILEVIALASGRLFQLTAARAVDMSLGDLAKHVAVLRVAHLLRTTGMRGTDSVEPYHDRVRRAVLSHLDAATLRNHHRRLAVALETSGQIDPEHLAVHWREAGDAAKAAHFAQLAGDKAAKALAFDRAARFYHDCIELAGAAASHDTRVRYADALANAGRGVEAGHAYLAAAAGGPHAEGLDLRRKGAEQLLRAGHIDAAMEIFRGLRDEIDMPLAQTPKRALAGLLMRRMQLRLRGIRFTERSERDIPASNLLRIDTGFSMALALSTIDTIRGSDLQTRSLLLALDAGEPYRVARALALEAAFNAAGTGFAGRVRTERLVRHAHELARRIDHPHALGLALWAEGSAAYLEGRFADGYTLNEQALEVYRNRCTGVTWEVASAQSMSLWALHYLGRIGEIARRLPELLKAADRRGDRYDATTLRTSHTNICWLAADQPVEARDAISSAMKEWSPGGIHLQHYYELYGLAQNELYIGDGEAAWQRLNAGVPRMKSGFLLNLQIVRIEIHFLHARTALAAYTNAPREELLAAAERDARALAKEKTPFATALCALVRASIAAHRKEAAAEQFFDAASRHCDAAGMSLHAAIARRCRGLLLGDGGATIVASAEEWMRSEGVRAPARMSHLHAPLWKQ
jgi:serine/threonine protein kinase